MPLKGKLRPGLQRMPWLQLLDLSNNALSGTLPPEWGEGGGSDGTFPQLQRL